jgi:hypothetical protein
VRAATTAVRSDNGGVLLSVLNGGMLSSWPPARLRRLREPCAPGDSISRSSMSITSRP